jgi:hypothetical protein
MEAIDYSTIFSMKIKSKLNILLKFGGVLDVVRKPSTSQI